MKTIKFYGALGKRFGKNHKIDVKSPAEAIRAFSVILKGFKKYMIEDDKNGYKIFIGTEDLYTLDMHSPTSDKDIIRIVPMISGSGSGKSSLALGMVLIVLASVATGGAALGAAGAAGGTAGASAGFLSWASVSQLGVVLAISGISSMIFGESSTAEEKNDSNPNYAFDGVINTTRQGSAVPVGYGTLRIGSQVISAGLTTE